MFEVVGRNSLDQICLLGVQRNHLCNGFGVENTHQTNTFQKQPSNLQQNNKENMQKNKSLSVK